VAKLGGTGLGLVALLSVESMAPGTTSPEELRRLGRFLRFMQKPEGSFYSKYLPAEGGRSDAWTSLYYPGEAVLGLVMLYQHDSDPQWLEAAARGLDWLARSRENQRRVEADHWALLATARLLEASGGSPLPVPRERLLRHAAQICNSILDEQPQWPSSSPLRGGFAADGRTCPTATRLEGLLAALQFLPAEEWRLRQRIEQAVYAGVAFLLRAQVETGSFAGAIPRSVTPQDGSTPIHRHGQRATEVRIDYVQHALSALIAFDRWRSAPSGLPADTPHSAP
jgi:hypothetical protein